MKRNPFLTFLLVIALLVSGTLWFIQSPQFARVLKFVIARHLPTNLGVIGDFTDLKIKFFPPGLSINHPKIDLSARNILNLPAGTSVGADRIDLNFKLFQAFSGRINADEAVIVNGEIKLVLDLGALSKRSPKKGIRPEFHWDELLQFHSEAIVMEHTKLDLQIGDDRTHLNVPYLRFGQWDGRGGLGYALSVELAEMSGDVPKAFPFLQGMDHIESLKLDAHMNANGAGVDRLVVKGLGAEVEASGSIKGNLLQPKDLMVEAEVKASADLARAEGWLPRPAKPGKKESSVFSEIRGSADFSGKIWGNLMRLGETLKADGKFNAVDFAFRQWKFDHLQGEGVWAAAPGGGEISIAHATASSAETERSGLDRPGGGGKIEVKGFKFTLGSREPLKIPVVLERAHVQWLGAPVVDKIFSLCFRLTGPATIVFQPGQSAQSGGAARSWSMQVDLALSAQDFLLDNQVMGKSRPEHAVLKIPKIDLDGDVIVDSTGIRPAGLIASLPHTKLRASGKIDFKTGYDLNFGSADVDLSDVGEISENKIEGSGSVEAHVHGPASAVVLDFDVDLKDASYMNLHYGDLSGRVTWDDDPNHLILSKIKVKKNRTEYTGDGMLDLGAANTVSINISIPNGDIQDLLVVTESLTKDLWWFPRSLNGPVSGTVKVSGGVDTKALQVFTQLNGKNWLFKGEHFRSVDLSAAYDRGKYSVSSFKAVKRAGSIAGAISVDSEGVLDWDIKSADFTLTDVDHVAQLDVPVRGSLSGESRGHGKEGSIESSTRIDFSSVIVRGFGMPDSHFSMKTQNGIAEVHAVAFGGQGTLDGFYGFSPGSPSNLKGELKKLDFSPALLLLNPKLIQDKNLVGSVSGSIDLSFKSGQIERAGGKVEISDYVLAKTGSRFEIAHPVSFRLTDGTFEVDDLTILGNAGTATLRLKSRESKLDGNITGDFDMSVTEFLTSSIVQASGAAELDFEIGGTIKSPVITGTTTIAGATLKVASVESPFENVEAELRLNQNVITIEKLQSDLAGGQVSVSGNVEVFADQYPKIDLAGRVNGSKIKVFPFQYAKVHGGLSMKGDQPPYLVSGAITVESALCKEKVFQQRSGSGLKAIQYTPPPVLGNDADFPKIRLKIDVSAERGVFVQDDLFDAEMKGKLTIINTLEAPRILGTVEVVQGKMIFKDRKFQIQSATGTFDNPAIINPAFNMTATTDVNGVKIQLYVSGRIDQWKVELTSNPVMGESDILTLLATGMSSSDVKKLTASDRSMFDQGEAASLILNSLDFNREVQDKTGLQIKLDESLNALQGTSAFRAQTQQTENSAAPRIVIKKQITDQLGISYGSTVGVGTSTEREVNAELNVRPDFSIIGVWDDYQDVESEDRSTSMGVDFKWQRRFK